MKFIPEVIAALAVLREHAENDFERHRIDVLERDLIAPPSVEVVDERTQIFDGERFYLAQCGHFKQTKTIHQKVWTYCRGAIPSGYQIHHIDHNKANNNIANLQLMTASEHQSHHMPLGVTSKKLQEFTCEVCGKKYTAYKCGSNRFCSSLCRSRYRQSTELEKRVCPQCGKEFVTYRGNKARHCSHACSMDAKRKHYQVKRICPTCGKEFITTTYANKIYCSRSCVNKGRKRRD